MKLENIGNICQAASVEIKLPSDQAASVERKLPSDQAILNIYIAIIG